LKNFIGKFRSPLLWQRDIHRRALFIALVVGTILNCINQAPEIIHGEAVNFIQVGLTFVVPYCVSIYTALAMSRKN